jgi:hypothetical protein
MHRFLLALALIVIVQPTAAQESDIAVSTVSSLWVDETSFGVVTVFRSGDRFADTEPRALPGDRQL